MAKHNITSKISSSQKRFLFAREDIRALLQRLDGVAFLAAALAYGSGLRLSEIANLRVADLDFDNRLILIREQDNGVDPSARVLVREALMPRSIELELRVQSRAVLRLQSAVAPDPLPSEVMLFEGSEKRLQRPVTLASRAAGVDGLTLRSLRTAFISELLSLGNKDAAVLRLSGLPDERQLAFFPLRLGLPYSPATSPLDLLDLF